MRLCSVATSSCLDCTEFLCLALARRADAALRARRSSCVLTVAAAPPPLLSAAAGIGGSLAAAGSGGSLASEVMHGVITLAFSFLARAIREKMTKPL